MNLYHILSLCIIWTLDTGKWTWFYMRSGIRRCFSGSTPTFPAARKRIKKTIETPTFTQSHACALISLHPHWLKSRRENRCLPGRSPFIRLSSGVNHVINHSDQLMPSGLAEVLRLLQRHTQNGSVQKNLSTFLRRRMFSTGDFRFWVNLIFEQMNPKSRLFCILNRESASGCDFQMFLYFYPPIVTVNGLEKYKKLHSVINSTPVYVSILLLNRYEIWLNRVWVWPAVFLHFKN